MIRCPERFSGILHTSNRAPCLVYNQCNWCLTRTNRQYFRRKLMSLEISPPPPPTTSEPKYFCYLHPTFQHILLAQIKNLLVNNICLKRNTLFKKYRHLLISNQLHTTDIDGWLYIILIRSNWTNQKCVNNVYVWFCYFWMCILL